MALPLLVMTMVVMSRCYPVAIGDGDALLVMNMLLARCGFACSRSMSTLLKFAVLTETAIGDGDAAVGDDGGGDGALGYLRVRQWRCAVGGEYVDGVRCDLLAVGR